jgi:hypothetical protein
MFSCDFEFLSLALGAHIARANRDGAREIHHVSAARALPASDLDLSQSGDFLEGEIRPLPDLMEASLEAFNGVIFSAFFVDAHSG